MGSQWLLLFGFIYAVVLFFIGWRVERWRLSQWVQPLLYSLSLAVYCSSWTFLGAVGQAVDNGWSFLPIYLGPILLFIFGWRFVRRLLVVSSRNKVTSIADFIGSRYGKSQILAAAVTIVAVVGSLPYIALQLKAISLVWNTVNIPSADDSFSFGAVLSINHSGSLITALLMAWFAILFGTRVIDGPRRHQGMMAAISFESFVKLLAFLAVGCVALKLLAEGVNDNTLNITSSPLASSSAFNVDFLTQTLLAMAAIVCLPRQFHVMIVEYHRPRDIRAARWLLPVYLLLFSLLIIPVALVSGHLFAGQDLPSEAYVLLLPMELKSSLFTSVAFIGAISAATGMVLVAALTLSIMISNELVVPIWLKLSSRLGLKSGDLGAGLKRVRRVSIIVLLLLAWLLELSFSQTQRLSAIGLISFAAAAQLVPAVIGAIYWSRGHRNGVLAGICVGFSLWFYCLLLPPLLGSEHLLVAEGPWGLWWLSPINLLGTGGMGSLSHGVFWSLLCNCSVFVLVSKRSQFNGLDVRQANVFTQLRLRDSPGEKNFELTDIEVRQLQTLLHPLLGESKHLHIWKEFEKRLEHRLLPHDRAPRFVVAAVEETLASIVGAVSAHRAINLLRRQQAVQIEDFVTLMGGRSRQLQFSQELLQTTLETVPQGISVIDGQLQMVAWNQSYQDMFDYPSRLLYVGCPIEGVYHFNARRGYFGEGGDGTLESEINRRITLLREGKPHRFERRLPNGLVIEIRGTPINRGGYVTTYTDITDYRHLVDQLEKSKIGLEERVSERTLELSQANAYLKQENSMRAKVEKELSSVHHSKIKFLAAASHDLLQPINAARLFVAAMQQKISASDELSDRSLVADVNHIDASLAGAENLISSLREVSRLDSGKLMPQRENVSVSDLLNPLASEFKALAKHNDLQFHSFISSQWVFTDRHLLRRVLQNFLSNSLRYTRSGKILLGCRRREGVVVFEVWDTGPGIAEQDQSRIFEEFERLGQTTVNECQKGLGLGLSIANRMSHLLGHPLTFDSWLGRGSVFRIAVPVGKIEEKALELPRSASEEMQGLKVLCIDNEATILLGMQALLEQWGCHVTCVSTLGECLERWKFDCQPDIVLADYHLDDDETGLNVLKALTYHWGCNLSAVVISASNTDELRHMAEQSGYMFLPKPVQPGALRGMMRNLLRRKPSV